MRSILAKAGEAPGRSFELVAPEERALAVTALRYGDVLADVASTLEPHRLCTFVYELSTTFTAFYESCPVLRAETAPLRASRLALCDVSARMLAQGLGLLGIETPDRL
jgi:arginyl-tRNA synthetase